jgi:predicted nucleic-acid-binding protein
VLAVDINVVVRYLTRDDPQEAARSKQVIEGSEVFVATTVLLETEWVLRGSYRFNRAQIVEALRGFSGLPNVVLEDAALAATALDWSAAGMDFADALHLARAEHCDAFVTFDWRLAAAATGIPATTVRTP